MWLHGCDERTDFSKHVVLIIKTFFSWNSLIKISSQPRIMKKSNKRNSYVNISLTQMHRYNDLLVFKYVMVVHIKCYM